MNQEWIVKEERNSNLIIFFSGWSCERKQFLSLLNFDNYDVVILSDYTKIEQLSFDYNCYGRVVVIAWSFGVYVASLFNLPESWLKIAINGTPLPINDEYGIPKKAFEVTLSSITTYGIAKFNKRISRGVASEFIPTTRDKSSITEELQSLYESSCNSIPNTHNWEYAIISTNDLIFPTVNLLKYWNKRATFEPILIEAPHYPFVGECIDILKKITKIDK